MTTNELKDWKPDSWRSHTIRQQPHYDDMAQVNSVLETIRTYPPLVFHGEVDNLKHQLAEAAKGHRFILQGGDCAERFQDCNPKTITSKLKIILQMSVILSYSARCPVIRIGRIAGQYAKPRSSDTEKVNGQDIPVFRGDNINSFEATAAGRKADPTRMLRGYHTASLTLNYVRAMIAGGFADLQHPENWNLTFFDRSPHKRRYELVRANIEDAVAFMGSFGGVKVESLGTIDFFTSHEGLLLGFEEAMTRFVTERQKHYNLGAHMLWIGDRTRALDEAHVEYFRGIANPIGIKWGPTAKLEEMVQLVERLNPSNEWGRITLITRFGEKEVAKHLPAAIKKMQQEGLNVLWTTDPMHGNMVKTSNGTKTRNFNSILNELRQCFEIHKSFDSHLGGVHFEMTGEEVTECVGGAEGIGEKDLANLYETFCDPRLNYSQSLEMAFLISSILNPKASQQLLPEMAAEALT